MIIIRWSVGAAEQKCNILKEDNELEIFYSTCPYQLVLPAKGSL
jgi:hypothetical protein